MEPVTLRTARLTLSAPTEDDVDAIFDACQDADIQRFTTVPSPYERRNAEDFIPFARSRWVASVEATWAIRLDDTLVGMISLHGMSPSGAGEIGYWMAAGARRRGLLTEAARAVIDWGFSSDGPGLKRIEWRAVVGNVGSARIARSLGFRYEGVLRSALANSFGRDDGWIAALLPTDDRMPHPWPVLED